MPDPTSGSEPAADRERFTVAYLVLGGASTGAQWSELRCEFIGRLRYRHRDADPERLGRQVAVQFAASLLNR